MNTVRVDTFERCGFCFKISWCWPFQTYVISFFFLLSYTEAVSCFSIKVNKHHECNSILFNAIIMSVTFFVYFKINLRFRRKRKLFFSLQSSQSGISSYCAIVSSWRIVFRRTYELHFWQITNLRCIILLLWIATKCKFFLEQIYHFKTV